jgi:hypothetical protein
MLNARDARRLVLRFLIHTVLPPTAYSPTVDSHLLPAGCRLSTAAAATLAGVGGQVGMFYNCSTI